MSSSVTEIESLRAKRNAAREKSGQVVVLGPQVSVGSERIVVMAGPCSVESEEHMLGLSKQVADLGATVVRGAIFKPRTSPYTFQGLGKEGITILKSVKEQVRLPIVTEILDVRTLDDILESVDLIQVGARNMYNYPLLKELGSIDRPVLLKRAFMATIDEFIGAAEYLLSRGNPNVILCERGIRSFDGSTRFSLDLNAVPVLKEKTRLPVIVDPSHGTGVARYVEPMALAAIAAGADGLMIEVHNDPQNALSDGNQSLTVDQFETLVNRARKVAQAVGRSI